MGGMKLAEARFKALQIIHRTLFRTRVTHASDLLLLVPAGSCAPIHFA
jgi:hypothetical protein